MYEVFDTFLAMDTWHTSHPLDDDRFYKALHRIVRDDEFNPDEMGRYLFMKTGVQRDNEEDSRVNSIGRRVSQAWSVKDYLEAMARL
jgi:hypothetical protein